MGNTALVGRSEGMTFGVDKVAEGLGIPWEIIFLNSSEIHFFGKERGVHPNAQNLLNHAGSILRVRKRGYINL